MAQWVNRLRNNIFVNPPPLPLLCEISGALHLAQPGLTAGWQAGWQAGLVSRGQTAFFRFYLWWRKKGSGLVHTRISSSHL